MIRTTTKCTTTSSTKMNKTHLITTSTLSSAYKVIRERFLDLKTRETNIMLKITSEKNEVLATTQAMTHCFKLGKTTNQYKQLCSSIIPASSTCSLNERDYSNIEQ